MGNTYGVKHKRQTLEDFQKDIHRFTFFYNGQKELICVSGFDIFFDEEDSIPEGVQHSIARYVWYLMTTRENTWATPAGAQKIADAYCAEEFG